MSEVIVTSVRNLQNEVRYEDGEDGRSFLIDEPASVGGEGAGPDPYTLLLSALGGCINMTVTLYARRKGWPLERVTVRLRQQRIHAKDCVTCEANTEGFVHQIERSVTLEGPLTDEQRTRLQEIAHKCPVHKTLTSPIVITDLAEERD
ncbi:MAG TPA: OsmC family protein [Pyrinomonadaceae bacterium]|nr:OsmC family protein [Pyrinomonadaceae bacterium]